MKTGMSSIIVVSHDEQQVNKVVNFNNHVTSNIHVDTGLASNVDVCMSGL